MFCFLAGEESADESGSEEEEVEEKGVMVKRKIHRHKKSIYISLFVKCTVNIPASLLV